MNIEIILAILVPVTIGLILLFSWIKENSKDK